MEASLILFLKLHSVTGHKLVKGPGSRYFRILTESVKSVGVVKSTFTVYAVQHEYQAVGIQVDYTYTEKYPDPNVVTVAL